MSKSCFLSIRDLRRIRYTVDYSTAQTIAASLIHPKVDHCNSFFSIFLAVNLIALNLFSTPQLELFLKPLTQPYLAYPQIFTLAQKWSTHPAQSSLSPTKHCNLKILPYLYNFLNLQASTSTRSSTVITLQRPPVNSRLKITNRFIHLPCFGSLEQST